jgi:MarR family transcriptional repressor of emrRAB
VTAGATRPSGTNGERRDISSDARRDGARTANLLGALALTVTDAMREAIGSSAPLRGGATPAALVILHDEPGMSVSALGAAIGLSQPGAARLAEALEVERLITRSAGPDGRTHALRLTALGQRRVRAMLDARASVLGRLLVSLAPSERRQLQETLEHLLLDWVADEPHAITVCRLCDTDVCPLDRCPVELASDPA